MGKIRNGVVKNPNISFIDGEVKCLRSQNVKSVPMTTVESWETEDSPREKLYWRYGETLCIGLGSMEVQIFKPQNIRSVVGR